MKVKLQENCFDLAIPLRKDGFVILASLLLLCCLENKSIAKNEDRPYGKFVDYVQSCKYQTGLNERKYQRVVQIAEEKGVDSFWLPFERIDYDKFLSVDNSSYVQDAIKGNGECAYLDHRSLYLRSTDCSAMWLGGICTVIDAPCFQSMNTIRVDGDCFKVFMEKMNWFHAKVRCRQEGSYLATFQSHEQVMKLKEYISTELSLFDQHFFWIGSRKYDFYERTHLKNTPSPVTFANWGFSQPQVTHNCVAASKQGRYFSWKMENCTNLNSIICHGGLQPRKRTSSEKVPSSTLVSPFTKGVVFSSTVLSTVLDGNLHCRDCPCICRQSTVLTVLVVIGSCFAVLFAVLFVISIIKSKCLKRTGYEKAKTKDPTEVEKKTGRIQVTPNGQGTRLFGSLCV